MAHRRTMTLMFWLALVLTGFFTFTGAGHVSSHYGSCVMIAVGGENLIDFVSGTPVPRYTANLWRTPQCGDGSCAAG